MAAGFGGGDGVVVSALTTTPASPRLVESCIGQSGSPYATGFLAPGELASIYGAGLGPQQGVAAQAAGNAIGTELGGVQVLVENVPAPLLYVSSTQINLVAPYILDGRIAAHVKIVTAGATSNEVVLNVQAAAPEIFTLPGAGRAFPNAAVINQDGTVNSSGHPAHAGDVLAMWVSGLGQTNPAGMDGAIAGAAGGTPLLPVTVQVSTNMFAATVKYAGDAAGSFPVCRRN